ncbi:uncharacterized protein G2W53_008873 [Senna tora]|uniref:Uncharacterized protein n=1 Tax=Senna tora TaxID=362788 RepID=A0A835C752_9FABA|nr:uncharacterized protein G2W53_008873 [Senna tora]
MGPKSWILVGSTSVGRDPKDKTMCGVDELRKKKLPKEHHLHP